MSDNIENTENENVEDQNKDLDFNTFLEKFKETEDFKNYVTEVLKNEHAGLLKNTEKLLSENSKLKEFKNKASEDEVAKLITSGKEEDRKKAIELLNADTVSKYQQLLDERDAELNAYKEKEAAYIAEKEKEQVFSEFKKSKIFESVREEAIEDFLMPNVYANFKVKDGKVTYVGNEINKNGKPLNLEEYLVSFLKDRTFFLKEKNGSNLFSKATENNSVTQSKSSYEDRLRNKGLLKE